MKQKLLILPGILILLGAFFYFRPNQVQLVGPRTMVNLWPVRSIDTVKYSRDIAREKSNVLEFNVVINAQVGNIAKTGANYIALGTPYDDEFKPFLKRWVDVARKYHLNVWFRGNFSGWEGWFNYPKIDRAEHLKLTEQFILNNTDLFEDGDIFTPCSECENGGPGDPRQIGDIDGYRQFLKLEYQVANSAFAKTGKKVRAGYFSMNGDVARLVMDKSTTAALGGIVVIDHYVDTPQKLVSDIKEIASSSGGQVFLGEFGVPIPDITGDMSEAQQADWIKSALTLLSNEHELVGLNYWVNVGGSTQLWDGDNKPKKAVPILTQFYSLKR